MGKANRLAVPFPLWAVYSIEKMADKKSEEFEAFVLCSAGFDQDSGQEEQFFPFFTSDQLTREFVTSNRLPPCHFLRIDDREGFETMLEEAEKRGIHHVGIDAGTRAAGRVFAIDAFLRPGG